MTFLIAVADFIYRSVVLFTLVTACTHLQKIDRVVKRLDTLALYTAETARKAGAIEKHLAEGRAEQIKP